MTSEQPFITGLDAKPNDWDLRTVYSDWLEEQGRCDEALLQRWLVAKRLRPATPRGITSDDGWMSGWNWWPDTKKKLPIGNWEGGWGSDQAARIPAEVFVLLGSDYGRQNIGAYRTRKRAEAALLRVLKHGGLLEPILSTRS